MVCAIFFQAIYPLSRRELQIIQSVSPHGVSSVNLVSKVWDGNVLSASWQRERTAALCVGQHAEVCYRDIFSIFSVG